MFDEEVAELGARLLNDVLVAVLLTAAAAGIIANIEVILSWSDPNPQP